MMRELKDLPAFVTEKDVNIAAAQIPMMRELKVCFDEFAGIDYFPLQPKSL